MNENEINWPTGCGGGNGSGDVWIDLGGDPPLEYVVFVESQRVADVISIVALSPTLGELATLWKEEPSWFKDTSAYELLLADDPLSDGKCWHVVPAGLNPLAVNFFSVAGRAHMEYKGMRLGDITVGPETFRGLGEATGVEAWLAERKASSELRAKTACAIAGLRWPSRVKAAVEQQVSSAVAPSDTLYVHDEYLGTEGTGLVAPAVGFRDLVRHDAEEYVDKSLSSNGSSGDEEPRFDDLEALADWVWIHPDLMAEYMPVRGDGFVHIVPSPVESWEPVPLWAEDGSGYAKCRDLRPAIAWQELVEMDYSEHVPYDCTWKQMSQFPGEYFVSPFKLWTLGLVWRKGWWYRPVRRGGVRSSLDLDPSDRFACPERLHVVPARFEYVGVESSAGNGLLYGRADMERARVCSFLLKKYGLYMSAVELLHNGLAEAFSIVCNGSPHDAVVTARVRDALVKVVAQDVSDEMARKFVQEEFVSDSGCFSDYIVREFGYESDVDLPNTGRAASHFLRLFVEGKVPSGSLKQLLADVGLRALWMSRAALASPMSVWDGDDAW